MIKHIHMSQAVDLLFVFAFWVDSTLPMSPCVRISPNEYETMCCLQAILERTSHKIEELHLDGNSVTDSGVKALQRESK